MYIILIEILKITCKILIQSSPFLRPISIYVFAVYTPTHKKREFKLTPQNSLIFRNIRTGSDHFRVEKSYFR